MILNNAQHPQAEILLYLIIRFANVPLSQYEIKIKQNIKENKMILSKLGLRKHTPLNLSLMLNLLLV